MKERSKVQVETPVSQTDPSQVKVEEIPLPPEEMWKDLDNSTAPVAPDASAAPETKRQPMPAARLKFLRDTQVEVPLEFPFEWEGQIVEKIVIRRLTVGEVGDLVDSLPGTFDNYDVYAAMCGLPGEVLRGMIDQDAEKLIEVGYDFLPRMFRFRKEAENGSAST